MQKPEGAYKIACGRIERFGKGRLVDKCADKIELLIRNSAA